MKKRLALTAVMLAAALALTSGTALAEEKENKDITIGYICANVTNQMWLIMNTTIEQTAKEEGVNLKYMTAQTGDTSSWLSCFEDLVNMEVDAIIFGAADSTLVSTIEDAVAQGITCIEMDSPSGAKGTSVICVDNYSAAAQGANWVGEELGGKGKVILINGDATYTSGTERRNGYYETLQENYPDIEILEVWSDGWTSENAMNGCEDLLTAADDDVDAICCAWDGATTVIASLLESKGLTDKIKLVGFDGAGDALSLMREGKVAMDVAQPAFGLAKNAMDVAIKAAKGEKTDELVLDCDIVTPDMVDEYIETTGLSEYVK